jgi:hypothetical protein
MNFNDDGTLVTPRLNVDGNANIGSVAGTTTTNLYGMVNFEGGFSENVQTPTFTSTVAPDLKLGTIVKYTASSNFTFNGFTNPIAGQSGTIIITQGTGGSKLMTSTMKFAGGVKTLSTAAGAIDVISVFYDGTNYLASLTKGFV